MRRRAAVFGRRPLILLVAVGSCAVCGPWAARLCPAQQLHTPEGVQVLANKSFDDSDETVREY
jgi:hypothetical protein